MGFYKYVREAWKKPKQGLGDLWSQRLIAWRREQVTVRLDHPTRIDRARSLGYKAKPGFIIVRQRVIRGSHKRPRIKKGRRSKHKRQSLILAKNYQVIAEERASKKYVNCEVLNSYWVAEDGRYKWFEIILLDKNHPAVKSDKEVAWISEKQHSKRVIRGLTSAGRKSRGLRVKSKGAEKMRPSHRARGRKAN